MIENFLLDPLALWEAIQSVVEKTGFKNVDDVAAALAAVLDALEGDEVDRRTKATLGIVRFRAESPIDQVPAKAAAFAEEIVQRYSVSSVNAATVLAKEKVAELRAVNRRREHFHGKAAMDRFFKEHLHKTPMAKSVFKFEAARHASKRGAVLAFFGKFFADDLKAEGVSFAESTKVKCGATT